MRLCHVLWVMNDNIDVQSFVLDVWLRVPNAITTSLNAFDDSIQKWTLKLTEKIAFHFLLSLSLTWFSLQSFSTGLMLFWPTFSVIKNHSNRILWLKSRLHSNFWKWLQSKSIIRSNSQLVSYFHLCPTKNPFHVPTILLPYVWR